MEMTFSSPEAQRIAGISFRQLDHWCRTGVVRPAINPTGRGNRRRWVFRDLVALRAIAALRQAGASLQSVRRVQRALVRFAGDDEALRAGRLVLEQGRAKNPDVALILDESAVISLLRAPGQAVARIVFDMEPVVAQVRAGVTELESERARSAPRRKTAA